MRCQRPSRIRSGAWRKLNALVATLSLSLFASGAMAQSSHVDIKDAWARATPGGTQTGAAYVTVQSPTGDRLTGASASVAQKAELHSMTMDTSPATPGLCDVAVGDIAVGAHHIEA